MARGMNERIQKLRELSVTKHRFTLISKEQESRQIFTEKMMENIRFRL